MKYLSAYLLAVLSGKEAPSAADVTKILEGSGAEVDEAKVAKVVAELAGKDLDALIKTGKDKFSAVPSGGAAAAPAAGGAAPAAAKKEEKKVVEEEEDALDGGFSLFD